MKLTEEQAAEVRREVALAKNRMDAIRIQADLHDCSLADILEALGEAGADFTVEKNKLCYSDTMRQKVLEDLKSGMSQADVGKKYGVSQPRVSQWVSIAKQTANPAAKSTPAKKAPAPAPADDSVPAAAVGQPVLQEAVIAIEQLNAALQDIQCTAVGTLDVLGTQELALLRHLQSKLQGFIAGYTCAMKFRKKGAETNDQNQQS